MQRMGRKGERMRTGFVGVVMLVVASTLAGAQAKDGGVLGTWREPGGAKIEVHRCGGDVCLRLITLSKDAPPSKLDAENPDSALRGRSLLGLEIGRGFHLQDASHAEGGKLYDPKSGKTYSGSLACDGDHMKLRGYIGFKAFGRTEVWVRE